MRRGFTLLELMIVCIIVGVLATLGVTQYQSTIEKARGAEARSVIGQMRSICAALFLRDKNTKACTPAALSLGKELDQIPRECMQTNFFSYAVNSGLAGSNVMFTATRCTGETGKQPGGSLPLTLILTTDYAAGFDSWSGTGGY